LQQPPEWFHRIGRPRLGDAAGFDEQRAFLAFRGLEDERSVEALLERRDQQLPEGDGR